MTEPREGEPIELPSLKPGGLWDRPTPDLVLLVFATLIGLTILLAGAGVFVLEMTYPELDTDYVVIALNNIVTVIVGAVVGYVAGRRPGALDT